MLKPLTQCEYFIALLITSLLAFPASTPAAVQIEKIDYEVDGVKLQGKLVYDDAVQGKRPGVLVCPEWWGLDDYTVGRSKQLAEMGYVAFAVDMYGKGVTTNDPAAAGKLAGPLRNDRQSMRRRVNAALDQLKKSDRLDPSKIAAIGYCFGGTTALELARSGAPLVGVVSFHGGLDSPAPEDAKNIHGKILVCTGGDDPMVPAEQVIAFEKEMRDAKVDWQTIAYGGAKHAFTNPAADSHKLEGIAYNAAADHRSWQAMKNFFEEIFR